MSRDDESVDWGPPVDPDEAKNAPEDTETVSDVAEKASEPDETGTPGPSDADSTSMEDTDETPLGPPSEIRDSLLRDRIRDRLGVSPQQWYVIETLLLVLPYPVFVVAYFTFEIDETVFLMVTLAYSLIAMYIGFLS